MATRHGSSAMVITDEPVLHEGLSRIIGEHTDLDMWPTAVDIDSALGVLRGNESTLAILDFAFDNNVGIDFIVDLVACRRDTPLLVLSADRIPLYAQRALAAGARGVVLRQAPVERLVEGIRSVVSGRVYVCPGMIHGVGQLAAELNGEFSAVRALSNRELHVFHALGGGSTSRQMAADLGVSVKTIDKHRENIKRKLGMANGSQLMRAAVRWRDGAGSPGAIAAP